MKLSLALSTLAGVVGWMAYLDGETLEWIGLLILSVLYLIEGHLEDLKEKP